MGMGAGAGMGRARRRPPPPRTPRRRRQREHRHDPAHRRPRRLRTASRRRAARKRRRERRGRGRRRRRRRLWLGQRDWAWLRTEEKPVTTSSAVTCAVRSSSRGATATTYARRGTPRSPRTRHCARDVAGIIRAAHQRARLAFGGGHPHGPAEVRRGRVGRRGDGRRRARPPRGGPPATAARSRMPVGVLARARRHDVNLPRRAHVHRHHERQRARALHARAQSGARPRRTRRPEPGKPRTPNTSASRIRRPRGVPRAPAGAPRAAPRARPGVAATIGTFEGDDEFEGEKTFCRVQMTNDERVTS